MSGKTEINLLQVPVDLISKDLTICSPNLTMHIFVVHSIKFNKSTLITMLSDDDVTVYDMYVCVYQCKKASSK